MAENIPDLDLEYKEYAWDSKINICPGSTSTLVSSDDSTNEEYADEYKLGGKHTGSKQARLNLGSDSSKPDIVIPGAENVRDLETPELIETTFLSTINVCPGSTATLACSSESLSIEPRRESGTFAKETFAKADTPLVDWGPDSPWPDLILPGTWGTQALEEHPWDDNSKPYTTFRKYLDLELDEVEAEGVLTDRIIAACSSYLDKSPETQKYVLCKVSLANKHLTDIDIIGYHHYLQYVDLSKNHLTDVEALGQLPFLMYINVSHNYLTKVLDFKPPQNLTFVNYSHNSIHNIDDLANFWSIVHLDLSHNHIKVIEGLQQLQYLRHLNLSYNAIECIQNLNNMRLLTLLLQQNNITTFEEGEDVGLKTLIDVLRIDLAYNHLKTLKLFKGVCGIQAINMVGNRIDDLMEIIHLSGLTFLTEIDFRGNPIVYIKCYLQVCVDTIKRLYVLDGEIVDAEKKILVKHSRNSAYMHAMQNSTDIIFLQQINDPFLGPWIVPIDHPPPPIIILVGPPASNKGKLLQWFCKNHQKFTILGVNHTTRNKNEDEVEGESYYFVDDSTFRAMMVNGELLTFGQTFGKFYGLAHSEISKTVNESCALMLHMSLSGALTLRARGLKCHLVLAMPSTAEVHREWLFEKYYNWHDAARFVGVVEVENHPQKAQQFLSDCEKQYALEVHAMAKGIATNLVNNALETVDGIDEKIDENIDITPQEQSEIQRASKDTSHISLDSMKAASVSFSSNSGILRTPIRRTQDSSKASVTFKAEHFYQDTPEPSRSQVNLQSRVTFNENVKNSMSSEQFQLSKYYSISGTVIHENEHGSAVQLSTISRSKRASVEALPIKWDVQTEAIKAAVEEVVEYRNTYLHVHNTNPGLFIEVINTDDVPESLETLKKLLKKNINQQPNARPTYEFPTGSVYQKMVSSRLEMLHNDIKSELSISQKQFNLMDKPKKKKGQGKKHYKTEEEKKPQVGFNAEAQIETTDAKSM